MVTSMTTATPSELPAAGGVGHPPGMNGSDHHNHRREEEARHTTFTAPAAAPQPEPVAKAPAKAATPTPPAVVEEKATEEFVEPTAEPEPTVTVEPTPAPAPTKRAPPAEQSTPATYVSVILSFRLYFDIAFCPPPPLESKLSAKFSFVISGPS